MPELQKPRLGRGYPGKKFFGWCEEVCDAPELDRERECEHFVQATNSDVIRRMSDEELAKIMAIQSDQCLRDSDYRCDYNCGGDSCLKVLLDWLRQPAKEDT